MMQRMDAVPGVQGGWREPLGQCRGGAQGRGAGHDGPGQDRGVVVWGGAVASWIHRGSVIRVSAA
jgi:hypothetical protein